MKRAVLLLSAVLAGLFLGLGVNSAAQAQDEGETTAVHGTLSYDDEPVEGGEVSVTDSSGTPVGAALSAEDGTWSVPLPEPGAYLVALDESTLPEGLLVSNGRPQLEVDVPENSDRTVLFPLDTQLAPGAATETPSGGSEPADPASESDDTSEEADGDEVAAGPELEGSPTGERAVSLLFSGIHFGLMIALAAVGLSMVFGTTGLTNFAHGDLVTFGGMMALLFNITLGVPLWLATILAVAAGALFGWAQDWGLWSRLRRRGTGLITMMIISIGVALLIRFATLFFAGGQRQRYDRYVGQQPWEIGWLTIAPKEVWTGLIAAAVCTAIGLGLVYSRLGKATRAVADNPALAESTGIDVGKVVRLVWVVGGGLAAMAGVFLSINDGVKFDMGQHLLLLIFAAVILGGLGTAFGAFLGAMLIGVFVQLSTLVVSPELKYVGALVVLIVIMLTRPQGILGRRERIG